MGAIKERQQQDLSKVIHNTTPGDNNYGSSHRRHDTLIGQHERMAGLKEYKIIKKLRPRALILLSLLCIFLQVPISTYTHTHFHKYILIYINNEGMDSAITQMMCFVNTSPSTYIFHSHYTRVYNHRNTSTHRTDKSPCRREADKTKQQFS